MPIQPSQPPAIVRKLPAKNPDLGQLKTQAKELQQSYANGQPEALTEVARVYRLKPGETLTLSQAQLALARSYGFDSWPKLKAYVDGVTRESLVEKVQASDHATVSSMLNRRPEMVDACTGKGELRLIHLAVMKNDAAMLRLLMEHGADARVGIWPHRESTTPLCMATERGLDRLVAVIEDVETARKEALSCPNLTVSVEQEELASMIRSSRNKEAISQLEATPELMKQCDLDGATPLHVACYVANEEVVHWLCTHYADARKIDASGLTPIDHAVLSIGWFKQERVEPARRTMHHLLQRGCETTPWAAAALGDVDRLREIHAESPARLKGHGNYAGNRGETLTRAAQFGQLKAVRCLLDLGLNPDEPISLGKASDDEDAISWGSPLHSAAALGHYEIAELLLDRGADPNANVYASGWPLDRAYEHGQRALVDLLYARGAKPSVFTACWAHDVEAVRRMLDDEGDDPKVLRELVWSAGYCTSLPIFKLALARFIALQDQLTKEEVDWHALLSQPMRIGGPSHAVRPADYQNEDRFTILAMMLDAGADPNALGRFGLTLLHFVAARSGNPRATPISDVDRNRFATLLLDAGADPDLRDELLCSTALGWACRYGNTELVRLYLDREITSDEPETPEWATPLNWAEKMGHKNILNLLQSR